MKSKYGNSLAELGSTPPYFLGYHLKAVSSLLEQAAKDTGFDVRVELTSYTPQGFDMVAVISYDERRNLQAFWDRYRELKAGQ